MITKKQPSILRFVGPQRPSRFRFGLRTLLLCMMLVGPFALAASIVPVSFYLFMGIFIVFVESLLFLAWGISFLRPSRVLIWFAISIVISLLFVNMAFHMRLGEYRYLYGTLSALAGDRPFASISMDHLFFVGTMLASFGVSAANFVGLGLSWSRYADN